MISSWLFIFEEWFKCNSIPVFGPHWSASASVSQRYGSEDPDPHPRIQVRIRASGSVPKCHGSATRVKRLYFRYQSQLAQAMPFRIKDKVVLPIQLPDGFSTSFRKSLQLQYTSNSCSTEVSPVPTLRKNMKLRRKNNYKLYLGSKKERVPKSLIFTKQKQRSYNIFSVADPGSDALLTPGSGYGIRDKKKFRSWMNIPDHFSESLETVFWVKNT